MRVEEGSSADALALAPSATAAPPTWVMLRAFPRVQKAGLFVKDVQVELLPPRALSSLTVSAGILGGHTSTGRNLPARQPCGDTSTVPNLPARHPSTRLIVGSDGSTRLDPCKRDYPYVVAADPTGGGALLLCITDREAFADAAPADCPRTRYVLYDTVSDTSTVLIAPHQPGSIGLARRDGTARGQLVVAALTPTIGEDKARLSYCMPKINNGWVINTMDCAGPDKSRVWANNGVVAVGSKLFWVDNSQGILSCDVFSGEKVLSFIGFEQLSLGDSTINTHRRVQAIGGMVKLLQTDWQGGEVALAVWRLMDNPNGEWIHEYSLELSEIWAKSPTASPLIMEVTMVVIADPNHHTTINVLQPKSVFTIDALANTITECAGPCAPCDIIFEHEDVYVWELPPSLVRKLDGPTGCMDFVAGLLSLICKPMEVVNDEEDGSRRLMLFFRF